MFRVENRNRTSDFCQNGAGEESTEAGKTGHTGIVDTAIFKCAFNGWVQNIHSGRERPGFLVAGSGHVPRRRRTTATVIAASPGKVRTLKISVR